LASHISWGFFFLDDSIKIAVDGLESTIFHEASADSEEETIVPFDIGSFSHDFLLFAEGFQLVIRNGGWDLTVLSSGIAAAVAHDNLVIITEFSAVGDSVLDLACKGSITLGVGDIGNLLTFALWSEK
jgi:hypothetical protein